MKKLNVAIIGQGRSGKDIHGAYFVSKRNVYFNVKYVVDLDDYRRKISLKRYPGCEVFKDYRELFKKKDIDVVINASYSDLHYAISKELIMHGLNVVVEKPLAKSTKECQELIDLAKKKKVFINAFQQTFYAPYYDDVIRIMKHDKIGKILEVSIRYNSLSRRWDWQTLQKRVGGNAYNTGPHPIGIALGVLDFDPKLKLVYSKMVHTLMSAGDYDDYCKLIISAPNRPVVDIEINNTDAFNNYNLRMIGTRGTYQTNIMNYDIKYINPNENVKRVPIGTFIEDKDKNPCFCSEKLITHEEHGTYNGNAIDVGTALFYKDLYLALTKKQKMRVTPEIAMKVIQIIEQAHKDNPIKRRF
ncbi:MAG: Gfo/Idh/MocA family oxidoreductase [Bacilli bacterium]|nr:Gfo/Idh/MocA family oxidoreductase [Bacilli bacterium]